ncbi:cell envelope integrity protein TolA [bacterium]|nr:cell envelope integrity protein TolA [bacterium]
MAICNLLSLTTRNNQNYDPSAVKQDEVTNEPSVYSSGQSTNTDSMTINGRVIDLMGNLTDEQIEKVMKVGYNQAVEDFIDIITTNSEISDEELINLYFNATNIDESKINNKTRLRIIRKDTVQHRKDMSEKATNAGKEVESGKNLLDNDKAGETPGAKQQVEAAKSKKAEAEAETDPEEKAKKEDKAVEDAGKAKTAAENAAKEADQAIKDAEAVENNKNYFEASEETKKKAEMAKIEGLATKAAAKAEAADADLLIAEIEAKKALALLAEAQELIAKAQADYAAALELDESDSTKADAIAAAQALATTAAEKASAAITAKNSAQKAKNAVVKEKTGEATVAKEAAIAAKEAAEAIINSTDEKYTDEDKAAAQAAWDAADAAEKKADQILNDINNPDKVPDVSGVDTAANEVISAASLIVPISGGHEHGDDGDGEGDGDNSTITADITLTRKDDSNNSKKNLDVTDEGTTFKLANSIKGKKYKYTISANEGTSATIKEIKFLDNDRLLIVGDNLKIIADDNQADNIILMGCYNYIDTGDLNDTIRVGVVQDSIDYYATYWDDMNTGNGNKYNESLLGNTIKSGSGNDYVEVSGPQTIDMGEDDGDYLYDYLYNTNSAISKLVASYEGQKITVGNREVTIVKPINYEQTFVSGTSQRSDYNFGVASQGGYGDCQFLSFMNTFNGKLSDYVTISSISGGYKVTFKGKDASGANYSATVTNDELNNVQSALDKLLLYQGTTYTKQYDKENCSGDIDNALVEIAFRKVIANIKNLDGTALTNPGYNLGYNMDNYEDGTIVDGYTVFNADKNGNIVYSDPNAQDANMFGSNSNSKLISTVFYGEGDQRMLTTDDKNWFKELLAAYKNGEVTNLVIGTHQESNPSGIDNKALGIYYNHAYAIKDYEEDHWVEVVNPWDGKDVIRLDWRDFFKYFPSLVVYGDTYTYCENKAATSSDWAGVMTSSNQNLLFNRGGYKSELNSVLNLDTDNPFAAIFTSNEPSISDEINEITESIEAVNELLDEDKIFDLYS